MRVCACAVRRDSCSGTICMNMHALGQLGLPSRPIVGMVATDDAGPLGQKIDAPETYEPGVLFAVPRSKGRCLLGLEEAGQLPFAGEDVWNCYETSWLNASGVPRRAILELRVPCTSPCIVESKSLKLYLNSLNFKRFPSTEAMLRTIAADVEPIVGATLVASLRDAAIEPPLLEEGAAWSCVDDEEVGELPPESLDAPEESHLTLRQAATGSEPAVVTERLVSHLLRTRCPVTGQPDWGSVLVEYRGAPIDRAGLLRFLVSLRREVPRALRRARACRPSRPRPQRDAHPHLPWRAPRSASTRTPSSASRSLCSSAARPRRSASLAASSAAAASTSTRCAPSAPPPSKRRSARRGRSCACPGSESPAALSVCASQEGKRSH